MQKDAQLAHFLVGHHRGCIDQLLGTLYEKLSRTRIWHSHFLTSSCLYAADQKDCSKQVEEQFKEVNTTISGYAGTATYKKMQGQALQCFNSGRCGKIDVMLGTQEMMVDEVIVGVQREKLARLKAFLSEQNKKQNPNDLCGLANSFPVLIGDLKALNDKQFERFSYLAQLKFGAPMDGIKSSQQ